MKRRLEIFFYHLICIFEKERSRPFEVSSFNKNTLGIEIIFFWSGSSEIC